MKVRDAMTGDVLTMTPGRSLRDAAKFMADHNVGAVVIMDVRIRRARSAATRA